jgi:hypothetical protein
MIYLPVKLDSSISVQITKNWRSGMDYVRDLVPILSEKIAVWPNVKNLTFKLGHERKKQEKPQSFISSGEQRMAENSASSRSNESSEKWRYIFEASKPLLYVLAAIAGWALYRWIDDVRHRGMTADLKSGIG